MDEAATEVACATSRSCSAKSPGRGVALSFARAAPKRVALHNCPNLAEVTLQRQRQLPAHPTTDSVFDKGEKELAAGTVHSVHCRLQKCQACSNREARNIARKTTA